MKPISIYPIPALKDNYIWAIIDTQTKQALVVDPGDAAPVESFLQERDLTLIGILITHHHWDHTNGIAALTEKRNIPVIGPAQEHITGITQPIKEGSLMNIPDFPLTYSIYDIPGHTSGHIAYVIDGGIFCGDTLFASGCGRLFEGTAAQMYQSLQKIAALPDNTAIYCAHEYTLKNLHFAAMVEPDNRDIKERIERITSLRAHQLPSLPSFLIDEKKTNPFLRCHVQDVIQQAEAYAGGRLQSPVDVFAALRRWKDDF